MQFIMGENTTLAELLGLNLHECEEEVKNIVDKAVKEMSMEKILRDLVASKRTKIETKSPIILFHIFSVLIDRIQHGQKWNSNMKFTPERSAAY